MPDILPTITESKALEILRGFFLTLFLCPVERGQQNRVPVPADTNTTGAIYITPIGLTQLDTPVATNDATTRTIERHYQFSVQVDCYGANAMERATVLTTVLRDTAAFEHFAASGYDAQSLYADDPKQIPIILGDDQFTERWTFDAQLQLNQQIVLTTETANTIDIGLINVDATYPA